jgi:hypothetical protein
MMREEKEAYEAYLDRLSMPPCPRKLPDDEIEAYNLDHPLPTEDEINRILKGAQQ